MIPDQSPGDSDSDAALRKKQKQKQVDDDELSCSSSQLNPGPSHEVEAGQELASPSPELSLGPTAAGTVAVNAGASSSAARAAGRKRYVGVRQRPSGRWVAEIKDTTHKIRLWLGTFNNPEDAARAYDDAARTLRGANTRTNFARAAGTRPGFSSNSVRLLLQKAVEAAAVAGNLDSGGVLPSVAAAAAGSDPSSASAAAVPSSFTAARQGADPAGPSNFRTGFHSDSELALEEHLQASNINPFGASPRQGMSRSVSYDHATMVTSLGQAAAGPTPQLRLYSSFSADFRGSEFEPTTSGSFDLQQMQISNSGPGGDTFGSAAASAYEQPLDESDIVDQQGSTSYQSQYNIYESLREKLGRGGASQFGLLNRESSTSTFAEQGGLRAPVANMGSAAWNPNSSSLSSQVNLTQWGRSHPGLGVHGQSLEAPSSTGPAAVQTPTESWEHDIVGSRHGEPAGSFGLEEIPSVNWGNLGRGAGDGAERMDTIPSLNWEDLGRTSEHRPLERPTTINWGDLIDRSAGEARGMACAGMNNWGSMDQGNMQFPSSGYSRPLWSSSGVAGHHEPFSAPQQEYWESNTGTCSQMPTMGLVQPSSEQHTQNTSKSSTTASDSSQQWSTECQSPSQQAWSSKGAESATSLPPGLDVDHVGGVLRDPSASARPSYEGDMWATSTSQTRYTQSAIRDSPSQPGESLPNNVNVQQHRAISQQSVPKHDSAPETSSGDQGSVMDYSSSHPSNPDPSLSSFLSHAQADQGDSGLNFLLSSPGFFRMDSFPRRESSPSSIAAGDACHQLFGGDQAGTPATDQDSSLLSTGVLPPNSVAMEARQDSPMVLRSPVPDIATVQPSCPLRPKLQRINAACLVDIIRDGADDPDERSPTPTRLGEAVRSHLILGGNMISTQDLRSATRPTSLDVNRASDQ